MRKISFVLMFMLMLSSTMLAQDSMSVSRPVTHEQMTVLMVKELQLDESQQTKVAKLNKKYKTLIEGERREPPKGERPNGGGKTGGNGRPSGMGAPGGMGGGMPGGGMGGHGGMRGGPGGGMPSSASASYNYDEEQEKYDKALAKLLTAEQMEGYQKMKPQFASQRKIHDFLFGGQQTMTMPPGGGRDQKRAGELSKTGVGLSDGMQTKSNEVFSSEGADENAVQVNGGTLTLDNCHVSKSGDSSNGDATSFYGVNSAVVSTADGTVDIINGDIETDAVGANGVVAYGGRVDISGTTIVCKKNLSRGIHATGGGVINARNLNIVTQGNNSSVIATDRGGGTVNVEGGTYKASGKDCAVCYSTGSITVNNIAGASEQGEIAVIEGDNEVNIIDCQMVSGDHRRGMMILQSGSGDAEGFNGKINVTGGRLTLTSQEAPLIEITTSTKGTLTLKDVALDVPSGVLMRVDYNKRWRTDSPVATLNLQTGSNAAYNGDIEVDSYGTSTVVVDKNVVWTGAYDAAGTGKHTTVVVSGTWNLTKDSHVKNVVMNEGGVINRNGFQLIID